MAIETHADDAVILYSAMLKEQMWLLVPIRWYWIEMKEQVSNNITFSFVE